jgi:hypothetical protein
MADGTGDSPMTAAEQVLEWILLDKIGVPDDVGYSPREALDIIDARLAQARELNEIEALLVDRERKDEKNPNYARIMPEFVAGSSVYAKVKDCVHLLERRLFALNPCVSRVVGSTARLNEYLERRRNAQGTVYEEIHGYDVTRSGGVRLLASDIEALLHYQASSVPELREALEWYGDNARISGLDHSGGTWGRNALAGDGGRKAKNVLDRTNPYKDKV